MAPHLPPEIWALIAGHLSPGKLAPLDPDSSNTSSWHGSLANLCLASRQHRDLATPKLYECPMTQNTEAFMRTLFARPDLARYVKCLRHGTWNHWYEMSTVHDVPDFTDLLLEHTERMEERIARNDIPAVWMIEEMEQMLDVALDDDTEPGVNDAVALSLLPGLERIHLSSDSVPVCASSIPGSLPCLRHVVITNTGQEPIVLPRHLGYLALAAPNLSTLRIDLLMGIDTTVPETTPSGYVPVFPNVTTLDLREAAIDPRSYARILKAFPRLADLRCETATEPRPGITPRKLPDVLVKVHPRIKRLHFDPTALRTPHRRGHPVPPASDVPPWSSGLAELKELEYLATDAASLIPSDDTGEIPAETMISSVLPTSLRQLRVFCRPTPSDRTVSILEKSFKGLATAASDGFPLLRSVIFENGGGSLLAPNVARAFADRGIAFEEVALGV